MPYRAYRKKGSANWWIDVKVKGRKRVRRSSGSPDKGTAEKIAAQVEANEWKRIIGGDRATTTFAEAVMDYVADGKSPDFLDKLVKHFKDTPLVQIKAGHVRSACRAIYPKAKPATWNRQVITPARAVINHAAAKDVVPYIKVANFPVVSTPRRAPDSEWISKFIGAAKPRLGALMLLMRTTGARVGQALDMEWKDFDLKRGMAMVPHTDKGLGYPAREAELTPQLVAMLANLDGPRQGQVFGYKKRGSGLYKAIKAACKKAGIEYVTTHPAGRRGFFTTMHRAGVDVKTAAKRGGLASVKLALQIYTDADETKGLINDVFGAFESHQPQQIQRKASGDK